LKRLTELHIECVSYSRLNKLIGLKHINQSSTVKMYNKERTVRKKGNFDLFLCEKFVFLK